MTKYSLAQAALLTLAMTLCACAHNAKTPEPQATEREASATANPTPPKPAAPTSSIEAKQLAAEQEASYVTELNFSKGKSQLNADAHTRLSKIVNQARAHGTIEDVKVISWADSEYPSVNTGKLSSNQRKLAESRNEEIKRFLKNLERDVKVTTYNMAERPGSVATMLGTSNAKIKKSLEVAGIPNTDTTVKLPAKASRAIVMVMLKDR